jgi:hypothetical protein
MAADIAEPKADVDHCLLWEHGHVSSTSDAAVGEGLGRHSAWRSVWPTVWKALLVVVTLVLLTSVGGAGAVAAPLLLGLQLLAACSSRVVTAAPGWALLAAATTAEGVWALTFLGLGESQPWIWLIPAVVALPVGGLTFWLAWGSACGRQITA